jgi:poly(3-hydroxybutyrate) depolymerase
MSADVPQELPAAVLPAAAPAEAGDTRKTGRWVDSLGGDDRRSYWAYVPPSIKPDHPWALVVWLHPAGDTKEAEVLRAWQSHCDRRGIILVGPKNSQPSGWTPADVDFITDLVEDIRERYAVDPLRIVAHGMGDGSRMAAAVAFREREVFRGVSLVGAALGSPPPEAHPEHPLQFHLICGEDDAALEAVEETVKALRTLKFPVLFIPVPDLGQEYPPAEIIDALARWVDALDRI